MNNIDDLLIPVNGYWFNAEEIKVIEEKKNAKYLGYFCTKRPSGNWNEIPCDIFYVENPDKEKGHSNYFGLFFNLNDELMITNGESAFSEDIIGLQFDDGCIIISRYRHNYVDYMGVSIDGGRDYIKIGGDINKVNQIKIFVKNGSFFVR